MDCPHCQKELPKYYDAEYCPFCGRNLPPQELAMLPSASLLPILKINWWVFFAALCAPVLLTVLAVLLVDKRGDLAPNLAIFAGIICGCVTGILLGLRMGRTVGTRILLCFIMSAVMIVACVGMSCFGCLAGGYQLDLR